MSAVAEPTLVKRSKIIRTVAASALFTTSLRSLDVVAERHEAAHPHALLAGGGELVADTLADDLPLELSEREQDVQRQPSHATWWY